MVDIILTGILLLGICIIIKNLSKTNERNAWNKGNVAYNKGQYNKAYKYYYKATILHNKKIDKKIYKLCRKAEKTTDINKINKYYNTIKQLTTEKLSLENYNYNNYPNNTNNNTITQNNNNNNMTKHGYYIKPEEIVQLDKNPKKLL